MARQRTPKQTARPEAAPVPVIDLVAEPVIEPAPDFIEEPKPAEPPPPPPPQPKPPPRRRNRLGYAAAALAILAALAGAWAYRGYGEGIWPSERARAVDAKLAALDAGQSTLTTQLKEIGSAVDATLAREAELKAAVEQGRGDAASRVALVEAEIPVLKSALADIEAKLATLQAAPPAADGSPPPAAGTTELKALAARVEALEKQLAALAAKSGAPRPGAETAATLSQALSDLKAKFALGAPYKQELGIIASLVPAAPGLEVLAQSAEKGVANAEGLAASLRALAPTLPATSEAPPAAEGEGGFWDSVTAALGSVVTVKTIGETDWRGLALATAEVAASGDLRLAIERLTAPGGDMPAALTAWITAAKSRADATAALTSADAAVLRHIASLGTPQ